MKNFPTITGDEVVLMRAHLATGHVLDENFDIVRTNEQSFYTVIENVQHALQLAQEIVSKNNSIECCISGLNETPLYYITFENIKNLQKESR